MSNIRTDKDTVAEIDKKMEMLKKQRVEALKEEKTDAIKEVKRLIATYGISKGDIRGATMNILNGKKK